ncbi:MAG: TRAP transporter substrate-binding protein [Alphaproteobacteria bacterium]
MQKDSRISLRPVAAAAVALALAAGSSAVANAQEKLEVKVGISLAEDSIMGVSAKEWDALTDVASQGKVRMKLFASSALGKERAQLEGLVLGTHEVLIHTSVFTGKYPEMRFWDLPFVFPDWTSVNRVIHDPALTKDLQQAFECQGMVLLGQGGYGYRQFTLRNRPVAVPDDFKGMKHRVPPSKSKIILFESFGVSPSSVSFAELYQALASGVVDGQDNPLSTIYTSKFYEVSPYISLMNYVYNPEIIAAGKPFWDKLTKEQQAVLKQTAYALQGWSLKQAEMDDAFYLAKIREAKPDVKVNEMDPKNLPIWQERSKAAYEAFKEESGEKFAAATFDMLKTGYWKSPGKDALLSCK